MRWLVGGRELIGADPRSLAAFRIGLATVVLVDLVTRLPDLSAFYTDRGILPRSVLLETFTWLHEWPVCIHLIGGAWWVQALLFVLHAVCALSMLVGYRSRLSTFACWLLTASLQWRNLYIGQAFDAQLRLMLFWGCFLPLGACWSVDAGKCLDRTPREVRPVASLPVFVALAQVVIIYLATGYHKSIQPEWLDGTAVGLTFDSEIWATRAGAFLQRYETLCRLFTHSVLYVEMFGPLFLFVPIFFGPVRTFVVFLFMAMHVGFGIGLKIGIFPITSIACLLLFLPGWFWDRLARSESVFGPWAQNLRSRLPRGGEVRASRAPLRGVLESAVSAVLLLYLAVWNIGVLRDPVYEAPGVFGVLGRVLLLQQDWRMFAEVERRTGWVIIEGKLEDGTAVDLFVNGGPVPDLTDYGSGPKLLWERPAADRIKNSRWRAMTWRLAFVQRGEEQLLHYARYLCREWNRKHVGEKRLVTLKIFFFWREKDFLPRTYTTADYKKDFLWDHGCFR